MGVFIWGCAFIGGLMVCVTYYEISTFRIQTHDFLHCKISQYLTPNLCKEFHFGVPNQDSAILLEKVLLSYPYLVSLGACFSCVFHRPAVLRWQRLVKTDLFYWMSHCLPKWTVSSETGKEQVILMYKTVLSTLNSRRKYTLCYLTSTRKKWSLKIQTWD